MRHHVMAVFLVILCPAALAAAAEAPSTDAEVARGIQQVEEGDYDAAIFTLDAAARRLAPDRSRVGDLSQAYLYLGIAYLGKGHEAAARAKFRDAVREVGSLTLSPDKFPPKVIDLFEAARDEARAPAPAGVAPAPAPTPTPASPAPAVTPQGGAKKGGGSKGLLWVGLGAAAAGGAALALGGGGGGSTNGIEGGGTETFPGTISGEDEPQDHRFSVARAGTVEAVVNWTVSGGTGATRLFLELKTGQLDLVAESVPTGPTEARVSGGVTPGTYVVRVHGEICNGCVANYTIRVTKP